MKKQELEKVEVKNQLRVDKDGPNLPKKRGGGSPRKQKLLYPTTKGEDCRWVPGNGLNRKVGVKYSDSYRWEVRQD